MSEYQQYYNAFSQSARESNPDLKPEDCRCNGGGWLLSDVDTWHHCGSHYNGQRHPDDDMPNEPFILTDEAYIQAQKAHAESIESRHQGATDEDVPF